MVVPLGNVLLAVLNVPAFRVRFLRQGGRLREYTSIHTRLEADHE
jgi:hypothetical protein